MSRAVESRRDVVSKVLDMRHRGRNKLTHMATSRRAGSGGTFSASASRSGAMSSFVFLGAERSVGIGRVPVASCFSVNQ